MFDPEIQVINTLIQSTWASWIKPVPSQAPPSVCPILSFGVDEIETKCLREGSNKIWDVKFPLKLHFTFSLVCLNSAIFFDTFFKDGDGDGAGAEADLGLHHVAVHRPGDLPAASCEDERLEAGSRPVQNSWPLHWGEEAGGEERSQVFPASHFDTLRHT